jgi:hypothetical protein
MEEGATRFEQLSVGIAYCYVDYLGFKNVGDGLIQLTQSPLHLSTNEALTLLSGRFLPGVAEDLLLRYTVSNLQIPPLLMSLIGKNLGYTR